MTCTAEAASPSSSVLLLDPATPPRSHTNSLIAPLSIIHAAHPWLPSLPALSAMTRPTTSPLLSHLPLSLLSLLLLLLPPLPLALADSACSSVNPNSDLCNEATCPSWEDCTSCTLGWAGGVPLPIYTCDRPLDPTPLDAGVVLAIVFSCVGGLMVLFYCCACRGVGCFRGGRHHRWWMRKRAEWWAACGGQRQVGVGVVYQQQTAVGPATSKVQMTQLQLQLKQARCRCRCREGTRSS